MCDFDIKYHEIIWKKIRQNPTIRYKVKRFKRLLESNGIKEPANKEILKVLNMLKGLGLMENKAGKWSMTDEAFEQQKTMRKTE